MTAAQKEKGGDDESAAQGGDGGRAGSGAHASIEDDSIHSFEGHADAILAVAWSPAHPDLVATGGQDDTAFIWRVGQDAFEDTAGTLSTLELTGHTDTVGSLAFNSTGTLLATGGLDGMVKIWGAQSGALHHTFEGSGSSIEWLCWHPRGGCGGSGVTMQVFAGHSGPVSAGCFTPDGKSVVTVGGEGDSSLRVWSPKTGECSVTLQRHPFHEEPITCIAIHTDCATAMTGAQDGSVRLCNLHTGRVVGTLVGHEESVEAVGFSPHVPQLAASAGVDGKLIIWDLNTLTERGVCQHPDVITGMTWHPTLPHVFTACLDGMVRRWDLRTNELLKSYSGHTNSVQGVALSPDGGLLISGSDDNTSKVFQT
ncbi:MAG: hypothetical protein WDW36_010356 [Sanguina aurantia]